MTVSKKKPVEKAKKEPVIVPNRSEFIDISFPQPAGAKRVQQERRPEPAAPRTEPAEEVPGIAPDPRMPTEDGAAIAAAGR